MRKTFIALGSTVCILAAESLAIAAAIFYAVFHLVLYVRRENSMTYTVYRYDFNRHTREPVGIVSERRKWERGNNYLDLLKQARKTFSTPSPKSLVFLSPD